MSTAAGNCGGFYVYHMFHVGNAGDGVPYRCFLHNSCGYLQKPFDIGSEMCYHIVVQGSDEDTPRRMMPREEPTWCNGSALGTRLDTTSEPLTGNGQTGAPVKAPMSDGESRNQGGTVEYFCIPPLIFQGVGIFYTFSQIKRR